MLDASPVISAASPTTATTTSALAAAATASSIITSGERSSISTCLLKTFILLANAVSSVIFAPFAYITFTPAFLNPSRTVTLLEWSPETLHVPSILNLLSAIGPTSATVLPLFSGNTWSLFLSSTNEWAANSRAACLVSSFIISLLNLSGSQFLYGSSNNPSLYFASSTFLQALSICAWVIFPSCNDFFIVFRKPSLTMSMSSPAF